MIDAVDTLQFLRPHWLWALLVLPLVAWAWWDRRRRANVWRNVVDPHLLPHLVEGRAGRRGHAGLWLRLLACAIAVLALAGPSWRSGEQPRMQGGLPLVVVLDLSSESLATDLAPSRLLQARQALRTLLASPREGDVGLVVFADDAFTVAPLTSDTGNVALFLDALSPEIMPVDGQRADRGIDAAVALLQQAGHDRGAIALLAGRAGGNTRGAAARAAAAGFQVSVIGLGTPSGAAFRERDGSIAQARLDPASLGAVAQAGGGHYAALPQVGADIASLASGRGSTTTPQAKGGSDERVALDEGYWLLLPLMLLAMLAFRRGAVLASLLVCMLLPWQAQAQTQGPSGKGGLWQRTDQAQHARMREGIDAYRGERYEEAAKLWRGLPGAEAAYNAGNALARDGQLEEAIQAYDDALRIAPGMEDAIANRQAVAAALKRKPPPGKNDRAEDGDSEDRRDGNRQPSQDPSSAARPGEDGEPRDQDMDGERQGETPDTTDGNPDDESPANDNDGGQADPADAQAQREADAAHRQRMQQALEQEGRQATDGQQVEGTPDSAETEAERERRQASEAWLRRIPDDPGALLRSKFRIEHERRNGPVPVR